MAQSFGSGTDGISDDAKVASLISNLDRTIKQLDCDILAKRKERSFPIPMTSSTRRWRARCGYDVTISELRLPCSS